MGILSVTVDGPKAYIYDIEVLSSSASTGTGGRSSTPAPWPSVEIGATTLGLNVFGPNDGARTLRGTPATPRAKGPSSCEI